MLAAPANSAIVAVDLLVVDQDATVPVLERPGLSVTLATNCEAAIRLLESTTPHMVIVELMLPDRDGVDLCEVASSRQSRPYVLVTTGAVDRVPAALRVGCDGVLLKPFEPNLLFARIGRLLRSGLPPTVAAGGRQQLHRNVLGPVQTGTNRVWPSLECPSCHRGGIVSFDYTSHRRMWCACVECNHVWVAPRCE
ncbi:MAG: response regulator transcription factor [bacterium]